MKVSLGAVLADFEAFILREMTLVATLSKSLISSASMLHSYSIKNIQMKTKIGVFDGSHMIIISIKALCHDIFFLGIFLQLIVF